MDINSFKNTNNTDVTLKRIFIKYPKLLGVVFVVGETESINKSKQMKTIFVFYFNFQHRHTHTYTHIADSLIISRELRPQVIPEFHDQNQHQQGLLHQPDFIICSSKFFLRKIRLYKPVSNFIVNSRNFPQTNKLPK